MLSLLSYITFALTLLLPGMASAVDYVPLVGIPGLSNPEDLTLENYINALYILAISIAAFLAVVRLIMAGIKYILTDVVPNKESAKKDIFNSLLGLLIILSAFLILNTINPQLTNLAALSSLDTTTVDIPTYNIISTGFTTEFQPEVIGTTVIWTNLSEVEKNAFTESCQPAEVAIQINEKGQQIAMCTISQDTPFDPDLTAQSEFNLVSEEILSTFEIRNPQISSQIGTTVTSNDVRGLLIIEEIPGDDENAFGIALQPACEEIGGSHVANTFYGGQYEFWCVGNVTN